MTRIPLAACAAALGLAACTYGGEPFQEGYVPPPEGQYDYLEGELPYDTPGMTENEEELVESAGEVPATPARGDREELTDPVLGPYDDTLFDR